MKVTSTFFSTLAAVFLYSASAWSAGYDLTTPVSAKYSAIGGAAASSTTSTQAVLFNPAALSQARGLDLSVEIAPTIANAKGPITRNDELRSSKDQFIPYAAGYTSYKVTEDLGIGAGIYGGGGIGSDYGQVDIGGYKATPEFKSLLYSIETSLGAGYRINENFSVGAAWRISMIGGESSSAGVVSNTQMNVKYENLSGTNFKGFRVGTQYRSDDKKWGLGLVFRNSVEWKAKGKARLITSSGTASHSADLGDVTMTTDLPMQIAIGGHHHHLLPDLGLFLQYEFTNYKQVQDQEVSIGTTRSDVKLSWKNGHTFRLGTEYTGVETWAFRLGYVLSTPVVPYERPSIFLNPTAPAHAVIAGIGKTVGDRLTVDGAIDVSFASAKSTPAGDSLALSGEYKSFGAAAHAGLTYLF